MSSRVAVFLLPQPDRRARILRPGHPQHVAPPLGGELKQQEGCDHVRVFGNGCRGPAGDLFLTPDPVPRVARLQTQAGGFVAGDDAVVSGELEEIFEHGGRLPALVRFRIAFDEIDNGAASEGGKGQRRPERLNIP
jgi:hypothetical protein